MSKKFTVLITLLLLCLGTALSTADDPTVGTINPATAITGQTVGDAIGSGGIRVLPSGNLVIASPSWNGNRGAVTCLTPAEYQAGGVVVSELNSLVGDSVGDSVGGSITVLATGDYVVSSSSWDNGGVNDIGAMTWVDGDTCIPFGETVRNVAVSPNNSMIGSTASDQVGRYLSALSNGNYVSYNYLWDNATISDAGAATFCNGATGCNGVVSAANSLVGSNINDRVGLGITALTNGNYVVVSRFWNGERGAATWCSGVTGCQGTISASNSLVGSTANDTVGNAVTALPNGNYVVSSINWDNGGIVNVGAATWGDGTTGVKGVVSAANSVVGTTANDYVSQQGILPLTSGAYVISALQWDNGAITDAGAFRWCDGVSICNGAITAANAVIGSSTISDLGTGVVQLKNGNYVIISRTWDNGATLNVGAVRWCNGSTGCKGQITPANALIGGTAEDQIGMVTALSNGNYVVYSYHWDNPVGGIVDAGAVTLVNGTTGRVGVVSAANSLVGVQADDKVSSGGVIELTNGNLVVSSPTWDNGAIQNVGASTWVNGVTGPIGTVSASNSLIGGAAFDQVSLGTNGRTVALTNGNYVVPSVFWHNGATQAAGAVTWCDGRTACVGVVSASNSLVGSSLNDYVGVLIGALPNGNYVTVSPIWDNTTASASDAGMMAWGNGGGGTVGVVSAANAIVGSSSQDRVSSFNNFPVLPNGDYIAYSQYWDNGGTTDVGAIRRASGTGGTVGEINSTNALIGSAVGDLALASLVYGPNNSFFIHIRNWNNNTGALVYSAGPQNLLVNPSYENAGSAAKFAANWKLSAGASTGDKRLCGKPNKPIVRTDGACVFQFNSSTPLKTRTLKQAFQNPAWATVGSTLTLTADVEGLKVGTGAKKIILNVKYNNNTTEKATLTIPSGTYDYTPLIGTVTLTRPVKTITVTINVGKAKGRIRVDNLYLGVSAAPVLRFPMLNNTTTRDGASPFALPAAPDGFRH